MKIAITGGDGFLGWHARCVLRARGTFDVVSIARQAALAAPHLDRSMDGVEAVLHLAGVNRSDDRALVEGNIVAAQQLVDSLDRVGASPAIIYANSTQSGNGTPFGEGKSTASELLVAWGSKNGAPVMDVRLPNLFGEHGRPKYNSFVATFCHELANGREPVVIEDREVPLLHVLDAVDILVGLAERPAAGVSRPGGTPVKVSAILERLRRFRDLYATGDVPDIREPFNRALFNTYRSFCFPERYPIFPQVRSDDRGDLFECMRGQGGQSQVFYSLTRPGATRGKHFHLRKVERFLVVAGRAEIALRRLFHDDVVRFAVSGDRPAIVDMPTMWTHSITNTGPGDLATVFWANEVFDPANPDTYAESVELAEASP